MKIFSRVICYSLPILFALSIGCGEKETQISKPDNSSSESLQSQLPDSVKSYLYYALLNPVRSGEDTIFLEKDVYFFVNREIGALFFKKRNNDPFPVPKKFHSNLMQFAFDNFLATDPYKILERMSEMDGLLENSKLGIDIANHQSGDRAIDWDKVRLDTLPAPIKFVIMRSVRGFDIDLDPKFEEHYEGANKYDWSIGLYHNFVLNKNRRSDFIEHAKEQALKFVESFEGKEIDFKPILDIEEHRKYAVVEKQFTKEEIVAATKTFISTVEESMDTEVIIYSYAGFYNKYLKGEFDNKKVWIARYPRTKYYGRKDIVPGSEGTGKNPYLGISYDFKNQRFDYSLKRQSIGWQFTDIATVKGIPNFVDMNIILDPDFDKWLK